MRCRPTDASGDILPVLSSSDLLSGCPAIAAALRDYLHLYQGDWWENPDLGNEVLDLLSESRCTLQDAEALSSYLVSYLLEFPGVHSVTDISSSFSGHEFLFSCVVHTEEGETDIALTL